MTKARLDNVTHADLRVETDHGAAYGDSVNQVAAFLPEYAALQRHYPILFRRGDDGILRAVAILGFDRDENLFLAQDGRWTASYVPAMLRRGPFLIGLASDGEPVIHVDLDHPRVAISSSSSSAAPVFNPHGGHSPVLEDAMDALRTIHIGNDVEAAFSAMLDSCALVEPVRLEVSLTERDVVAFDQYEAVSSERIAALDGDALARLNQTGFLEPVIHAATSIGAMQDLANRKIASGMAQ